MSQTRQSITGARPLVFFVVLACLALAFVGDASAGNNPGRIAFLMGPDVYSMKPDGSDVKQLTNLGSQNIAASWESWSFDGSQIAFVEYPPNSAPGQLWLMNADGSNQRRVFDDGKFQDATPSFAPDGSHIVFTRCLPDFTSCAIYRVNPDGSGLRPITKYGLQISEWEPVYSPDGGTIAMDAFDWNGFASAIWLMDVDGSHVRRLTPGALGALNPTWSGDGKHVVFATNSHDPFFFNEEIGTINRDGTGVRLLTHNNKHWHGYLKAPHDFGPSWSPDGSEIAFERDSPKFTSSGIYVVTADGVGPILRFESSKPVRLAPDLTGNFPVPGSSKVKDLLKRIESGGFHPRWGPAQ